MKTLYQVVENKLEQFPEFRERGHRAKFLAILASRDEGIEHKIKEKIPLTFEELGNFGIKFDSYRRAWTEVLKERKDLQGKDYDQNEELVSSKLLELGYGDNRKLNINKLLN